jgi:hypothetical protein
LDAGSGDEFASLWDGPHGTFDKSDAIYTTLNQLSPQNNPYGLFKTLKTWAKLSFSTDK